MACNCEISVVDLEDISWRPTGPSCDNSSCRRHPLLYETSVNLGLGRAVLDDLIAQVFKTLFLYFVYNRFLLQELQSIGASGRAVIRLRDGPGYQNG